VLRDKLQPYFAEGRYQDALIELASLREPVDEFFENVMVNAEDQDVRVNRLTLLSAARSVPAGGGYFPAAVSEWIIIKNLPQGRFFMRET
jgi:glycyl-tRNA synthetase beta subunit